MTPAHPPRDSEHCPARPATACILDSTSQARSHGLSSVFSTVAPYIIFGPGPGRNAAKFSWPDMRSDLTIFRWICLTM